MRFLDSSEVVQRPKSVCLERGHWEGVQLVGVEQSWALFVTQPFHLGPAFGFTQLLHIRVVIDL